MVRLGKKEKGFPGHRTDDGVKLARIKKDIEKLAKFPGKRVLLCIVYEYDSAHERSWGPFIGSNDKNQDYRNELLASLKMSPDKFPAGEPACFGDKRGLVDVFSF